MRRSFDRLPALSAAACRAHVAECPALDRQERPVVARGPERQRQDAEGVAAAHDAARARRREAAMALPTCADDERPDALFVVSERGPDSRHESSPARVEAVGEIVCGAVVLRDVSQYGDRPTQRRNEGRGLLVTVGRARGDVTDCDQRCWAGCRVRSGRENERAGERDGRSSTLRRHRRAALRRSGSRSAPLLS